MIRNRIAVWAVWFVFGVTCLGLLYGNVTLLFPLLAVSIVLACVPAIDVFALTLSFTSICAVVSSFFVPLPTPTICVFWICVGLVVALVSRRSILWKRWLSTELFFMIALFFIALFFLSGYMNSLCTWSYDLKFDAQNFFIWQYGAFKGYVPMKDYFYLYGFLTYYLENSVVLQIVLWMWMACMNVLSYGIIKKLSGSTLFGCVIYFLSLLSIQTETYYWYFYRYGTTVLIFGLFTLAFAQATKQKIERLMVLGGVSSGLLFFLFFDQGIYFTIAFALFFFIRMVVVRISLQQLCVSIVQYAVGVLIGSIPVLLFCFYFQAWSEFASYIGHFSAITAFAKIPYFPGAFDMENMIATVVLWGCGFFLIRQWFFDRKYMITPYGSFQLGLFLLMALFQYKNCMRQPVGGQFISATMLLLVSFIGLAHKKLAVRLHSSVLPTLYCLIILIGFTWMYRITSLYPFDTSMVKNILNTSWLYVQGTNTKKSSLGSCLSKEFERIKNTTLDMYGPIVQFVLSKPDFNGNLFVYPNDPMIYALTGQIPAPYFNGYDATPKAAQEKNIQYIEEKNIRYVVYRQGAFPVDGVSNTLRNATLLRYLFTHFEPVGIFNDFILFHLSQAPVDGYAKLVSMGDSALQDEISNIDMGYVPLTEGMKYGSENNTETFLIQNDSLSTFQSYLTAHTIDSKDAFLFLRFTSSQRLNLDSVELTVTSADHFTTVVRFVPCVGSNMCVIDLSRLPVFYTNRTIQSISISPSLPAIYSLRKMKMSQTVFW